MRSALILCGCALLYPLVRWRERRALRAVGASDCVAVSPTLSRVIPWVFPTPWGSMVGIRVFASCESEAASILVAKYLTLEKVS
jgi:hypothetical protein